MKVACYMDEAYGMFVDRVDGFHSTYSDIIDIPDYLAERYFKAEKEWHDLRYEIELLRDQELGKRLIALEKTDCFITRLHPSVEFTM